MTSLHRQMEKGAAGMRFRIHIYSGMNQKFQKFDVICFDGPMSGRILKHLL